MAIAFDVATTAAAYTATGTQTTSHAASASARAAVVMIDQNASAADQVSTVTYGGVAMTAVTRQSEATEAGAIGIYWLDNIAPGTQNVAVTTTGTANKQVCIATMTVTAGSKIVMAATNFGTSASAANPSWDLTGLDAYNGVSLTCFEVIHSGLTTMTTTPHAGWTRISSTDLGSQGRGFAYEQIAPAAGIINSGWVATTADDFVGASVAFAEVVLPVPYTLGGGTLNTWINASDISGSDGSSVTSITESSPTARVLNTVVGTAPILRTTGGPNGTPILDHTAAAGGLHSATGGASTPGTDLTYFAVVQNLSANAQTLMMGQYWYLPHFGIAASNHLILKFNGMSSIFGESTTLLGSGWAIAVITLTSATSATHLDINDTIEDINLGTPETFVTDQGVSYGEDFGAGSFSGRMAEIGMYSSVLSGADITTLKDYLKAKYALPEIVLTPPDPPVDLTISVDELYITLPSTLPGTSTSLSLYENGVKIVGLLPVDDMYIATPRDANVIYSYTLRGDGPDGETGDSSAVVGTPNPSPPTGLTATPGDEQITLSWNLKSYSGTVYYRLRRDGAQINWGGSDTNPVVDTGLVEGSTHIYTITAAVFNPTGRESLASANVGGSTNTPVVIRNPDLISDVGGPSYSAHREDLLDDPRATAHQWALRSTSVAWSDADRVFSAMEFIPQQWLDLMSGPSHDIGNNISGDAGCRLYFESVNVLGPYWNFGPQFAGAGALWWATPHQEFGIWVWTTADSYERQLIHEIGHHINHVIRPIFDLEPFFPGHLLAEEFVAAVIAADALLPTPFRQSTYTNVDEMTAESLTALIVANADPGYFIILPDANYPAGVRADEWILKTCGNNADLTARWIADLTDPAIYPTAPWPVHRTMATQGIVDARRNSITIPIQNLDSNEGPTLLLADATHGYRAATDSVGTQVPQWTRSDRPLAISCSGFLKVVAGSPTVQLTNSSLPAETDVIPAVSLLGNSSTKWRTTVTFSVGELLAVDCILWHAIETSIGGIETEYSLTWNGATISASLIRRTGTGGTVIDNTTVTSANVLVVGERCTVQGVWGGQGTAIVLRHRTASAGAVTALTSAAMPTGRLSVKSWSMPIPHASNGFTLSYCDLAAVSVETIHDGGEGPMVWMDAQYT
jgi:hypothetical protein